MTISFKDNMRNELKSMFIDGTLMDIKDVADFCNVSVPAITQQALNGHLIPIYTMKQNKNKTRIFYYPDIVAYKKYRKQKGKFDGYDPYHKLIDTADRKHVKDQLEKFVWNKTEVCDYLGINIDVLNRLIAKNQIDVLHKFSWLSTRLFYAPEIKEFKIEYDTYLKFVTKRRP